MTGTKELHISFNRSISFIVLFFTTTNKFRKINHSINIFLPCWDISSWSLVKVLVEVTPWNYNNNRKDVIIVVVDNKLTIFCFLFCIHIFKSWFIYMNLNLEILKPREKNTKTLHFPIILLGSSKNIWLIFKDFRNTYQ